MTRRAWAVVAAVACAGPVRAQAPAPPLALPAAGPSKAQAVTEGDELTVRTAGQPDRRVRVTRVSVYSDGESLADVLDLATGAKYTIPAKVLAGMRRSGPEPRMADPQPVRAAPPSGSPAALAAGSVPGFPTSIPVPAPPPGSHTPFTPVPLADPRADRAAVPPPSAVRAMAQPVSPVTTYAPSPATVAPPPSRPEPTCPTITPPPVVPPRQELPPPPVPAVPAPPAPSITPVIQPPAPVVPVSPPAPLPLSQVQPVVAEFRVPDQMAGEIRGDLHDLSNALRPSVRERAATALAEGRYGWRSEVKAALAKAAQDDPAPSVRAHCIRLLSKLGYHESWYVDFLDATAESGPPAVRQAARAALVKLAPRS